MLRWWRTRKMRWAVRRLREHRYELLYWRRDAQLKEPDRTFWLALPYELLLALSEDYPSAGRIIANSVVCGIDAHHQFGVPKKDDVRAFYKRQQELVVSTYSGSLDGSRD